MYRPKEITDSDLERMRQEEDQIILESLEEEKEREVSTTVTFNHRDSKMRPQDMDGLDQDTIQDYFNGKTITITTTKKGKFIKTD